MLDNPLTPDEKRRTFDAVLVRALTDGQRCSSCSGLHPDVIDAIDTVAEAWLNDPAPLAANARRVFDGCRGGPSVELDGHPPFAARRNDEFLHDQ